MTECHLRKCNTPSLIRQIVFGLAAGALCLLVLSYSSPSSRQSEPEVAVAAPTPAQPILSELDQRQASGAATTLSQPDEAKLPLPEPTTGTESDGVQAEGVADKVIPTPMVDQPVSGAVPIVAEERVVPKPPMLVPASDPLPEAPSAAKPTASPEPVPKPEAKQPEREPSKVRLTSANILNQKNSNHLSVQLMGSSSLDAIEQFVLANQLADKVWTYQTRRHGSPWYVVLKGDHANLTQAQAAIRKLPPVLQKAKPWPKSFAQVKRELNQ